jgi:hypothetical protein
LQPGVFIKKGDAMPDELRLEYHRKDFGAMERGQYAA